MDDLLRTAISNASSYPTNSNHFIIITIIINIIINIMIIIFVLHLHQKRVLAILS